MFSRTDARFIRAMCAAALDWGGLQSEGANLVRIHGSNDRVIPPPPNVDHLIRDAGHLVGMTHPEECARIVRARVTDEPVRASV